MVCERCENEDECFAIEAIRCAKDWADNEEPEASNNIIRKRAYREATILIHQYLGRGKRIRLPSCIVEAVRKEFPDKDNNYLGFKEN
jgi:hypothetical protein